MLYAALKKKNEEKCHACPYFWYFRISSSSLWHLVAMVLFFFLVPWRTGPESSCTKHEGVGVVIELLQGWEVREEIRGLARGVSGAGGAVRHAACMLLHRYRIRQHTSAYVSIRQHTSGPGMRNACCYNAIEAQVLNLQLSLLALLVRKSSMRRHACCHIAIEAKEYSTLHSAASECVCVCGYIICLSWGCKSKS